MGTPTLNKALKRYMSELGKRGGKARAEKHNKQKLSEWGKLGGRPRRSRTETVTPVTQ